MTPTSPSHGEYPAHSLKEATAWGRWPRAGRGTWNEVTPQKAVAAAGLVRSGSVIRLDLPPDFFAPPLFSRAQFVHHVRGEEEDYARDDVVDGWNTQCSTHWDGLRHVREEAGFFCGQAGSDLGAEHLADPGLVTRAVLADVARWRDSMGHPLDVCASDAITLADLKATLAAQGSRVEPGDALLVRTGWVGWYRSADTDFRRWAADRSQLRTPGLLAALETVDWLWEHGVVAVAADNPSVEVWPLKSGTDNTGESLHVLAMVRRGIVLGELWGLEELAAACAVEQRWESMLVSAPLAFPGACAAPANAVAIR